MEMVHRRTCSQLVKLVRITHGLPPTTPVTLGKCPFVTLPPVTKLTMPRSLRPPPQQPTGPQLWCPSLPILGAPTLKTKTPLSFMVLRTLTPVLLTALRATVLPSTSPTPFALSVLALVRETRLETLVVGTSPLVTAMPQLLTQIIPSSLPMLGLPPTTLLRVHTKSTTPPVTQQFVVVPVLKTQARGAQLTFGPVPTTRQLVRTPSVPRRRCPHLRSSPIRMLKTEAGLSLTLAPPPMSVVKRLPPRAPTLCSPLRIPLLLPNLWSPKSLPVLHIKLLLTSLARSVASLGPDR